MCSDLDDSSSKGQTDPFEKLDKMNDVNENVKPKTFEDEVLDHFAVAIAQACKSSPELRQVAVVFDWVGNLNDGAQPCLLGDAVGPLDGGDLTAVNAMLSQMSKTIGGLDLAITKAIIDRQKICQQMEERCREAQKKAETQAQQKSSGPSEEETDSE